jgi:hypothetical protein
MTFIVRIFLGSTVIIALFFAMDVARILLAG